MNLSTWRPSISAGLAIAGGTAWGLCFGQETRTLLACFALAPLIVLLGRPRAILWAGLFAVISWLVALPWIATTLTAFGGLSPLVSQFLSVLLAAYLALDVLLFTWLGRKIEARTGLTAWWGLPALWVSLEAVRGLFFGGFPWNLAAYAWVDLPGALPLASWIGAAGVSFLVVAANVSLALGIMRRQLLGSAVVWLLIALILALGGRFAGGERVAGGREVRLIQPNSSIVFESETAWRHYRELLDLSSRACDEPALLVWPESAAWPYSWQTTARLREDVLALAGRGCPVIMGSALKHAAKIRNGAFLVGEGGAGEPYFKRRLVPFGEYVPLGDVLPFIGSLARNAGDFAPGTEPALLTWGGERLGMAICYEVIFAAPVAEQVRAGASMLVTITNDAWYGDTSAPYQHLRAAQFRAAENRRPMLRAALTGISAVIDARGRVVDSLGIGEMGILRRRIRGNLELAPFSRAPWAPLVLMFALAAFAIISAAGGRRTGGRRTGGRPE